MTALAVPRTLVAPEEPASGDQRIVLHDIPWETYAAIREALRDRPIFLTFDQGTLEIMVLSAEHERFKGKLARLMSILARHFRKNFESFGSFTQRRKKLLRGLEADDCFYIDSLPLVLGKKDIDLDRDPPPDVALEIDVTHSSLSRMPIFAALKVPEVWRFDGNTLTVHVLFRGRYEARDSSPTFPGIPIAKLVDFVRLGLEKGEMVMWDEFEAWLAGFPVAKPQTKPRGKGKRRHAP